MRGVLLLLALTACTSVHRTYDAATFFQTKSIRGASFSADAVYGALLKAWSEEVGVDIAAQAREYAGLAATWKP